MVLLTGGRFSNIVTDQQMRDYFYTTCLLKGAFEILGMDHFLIELVKLNASTLNALNTQCLYQCKSAVLSLSFPCYPPAVKSHNVNATYCSKLNWHSLSSLSYFTAAG